MSQRTGRRIPPIIIIDPSPPPTRGYQAAQDADCDYFTANPHVTEYWRGYIPGEAEPDQPAGTRVIVKRLGYRRIRGFVPPKNLEARN